MKYEKPTMVLNDDISEGVYLYSGSNTLLHCKSKYMLGIPQKPTYNSIQDSYKIGYGCDGCPAWNGNNCMFISNPEQMTWDADFRPSWEIHEHLPDEKGY